MKHRKGGQKAIDLRPCPFCGGRAIFEGTAEPSFPESPRVNYRIKCEKCRSSPTKAQFYIQAHFRPELDEMISAIDKGRDKAIAAWNGESGNAD